MKPVHWLLLCLSAVLYPLSIVASNYLWWLVFLFPIPLFYVATKEKLTAFQGFIWGLIAMGLHLVGGFIGVDTYAAKSLSVMRIVPGVLTLLYFAVYPTLWFWLTEKIKRWLSLSSAIATIALWVGTLWLYIFWNDQAILWICGRWEGYFLLHPLVSLGWRPALLMLLPYLGKNILSLLLYLVPAAITLLLIERSKRAILLLVLALLPWLVSLTLPRPKQRPPWLDKIVPLSVIVRKSTNLTEQARRVQQLFKEVVQKNPQAEVIIMPESSYYCDYLSRAPELYGLWSEEYLGRPIHLIVGSFRWEKDKYRNTVYWFSNGKLQGICDKRHAMALLEYVPAILNFEGMRRLFFEDCYEVTPATRIRPRFDVLKGVSFIPYICSELFFNEYPDDPYKKGVILSTSNDSWATGTYISDLMHLAALVKAIQWQRDILYISFNYATFFDCYGNQYPLQKGLS